MMREKTWEEETNRSRVEGWRRKSRMCVCGEPVNRLTFGEAVGLNNVEKSVHHVEEDPYGSWLVVRVGVINRRRYKPKVQGLHRRRWPLSPGVRPHTSPGSIPRIRLLLLAARGPPAEQQHQPPRPQHGSQKSSFDSKTKAKWGNKLRAPVVLQVQRGTDRGGEGLLTWEDTCPSRRLIPSALKQPSAAKLWNSTSDGRRSSGR